MTTTANEKPNDKNNDAGALRAALANSAQLFDEIRGFL